MAAILNCLFAFHDSKIFTKAKETQPAAYITKPYKADELERSIELEVFTKQKEKKGMVSTKNDSAKRCLFVKDGISLTKERCFYQILAMLKSQWNTQR